jgi:hypothetical protein
MPYLCFLGQLVRSSLFVLYSHTMDTPARYWTHANHEGTRTIKCRLSLYRVLLLLNVAFITLMILIDGVGIISGGGGGGGGDDDATDKATVTLVHFCTDDYTALWYAALLFSQIMLWLMHIFELSCFRTKACEERDILYRYGSSAGSRDTSSHLRQRYQARRNPNSASEATTTTTTTTTAAAAAVTMIAAQRCVTPNSLTGSDNNV